MTFDPSKRTADWTMLAPGVYLDPAGFSHLFPDEICAHMGIPYTKENWKMIVETFTEDMPRLLGLKPMKMKLLYHEREPEA